MSDKGYLVTADIPETLEGRYQVQLGPAEQEIREIQDKYLEEFEGFTPEETSYQVLDGREIKGWIQSEIRSVSDPVVTIDDIYTTEADELIDATRLTDPESGESVLGSRDPETPLSDQIRDVGETYEKIFLSDVGAFTGDTMNEIGSELEQYDVEITGALLPIAPRGISSKLNYPVKSMRQYDFAEWLEARDIAKIDGRKAPKSEDGDRPTIFYSENPSGWASIPESKEQEAKDVMENFQSELMAVLGTTPEELVGEEIEFRS